MSCAGHVRQAEHMELRVFTEPQQGATYDDLLRVAAALRGPHVNLLGVMTHAGSSYNCRSVEAIRTVAAQERDGAVLV